MDRMIFLAMTGAKHLLERQAVIAQNLANATTTGYRAQTHALRAVPVVSDTQPTRVFAVESTTGADFAVGPLQSTGRPLDVAVQGPGWIAVELADGGEAYTRNGAFQVSELGVLQTRNGLNIAGDTGPITIPPDSQVSIAADGTISTLPTTNLLTQVALVGRIKLVNPEESQLVRGDDGLFRLRGGGAAEADPLVKIASGSLESSNVNVAEALVDMIAAARQFDLQMRLMRDADTNARQAAQLLSVSG
jgi:flagellar basal-body rod protein FlgF